MIDTMLLQIDNKSSQAVYMQVANGLILLIRSGVLKPGSRLPSIRRMAAALEIHPKTVVAAYEEMAAQDWIYSKPRSGMVVAENLPDLKPRTFRTASSPVNVLKKVPEDKQRAKYKFVINDGFPDHRIAPFEQLMKNEKHAFYHEDVERYAMHADHLGSLRLRRAMADHISTSRGMSVMEDNILLTRGAQMAIYVAAALLIKPGDEVLVGEPGYRFANEVFEQLGAKITRVPVDDEGIDVDMIEKACKRKFKLLYIIPHHHHPTTVTLSAARRMKLLSLISRYRFYTIEDDYDYEFHYSHRPILPLASADHGGNVLYIGSITKNLAASMRLGYLIGSGEIITRAGSLKRIMDLRGDALFEDALASLFENGTMQRHIRKSLKLYQQRRDAFCSLLKKELGDKVTFRIPDGGMAVWVQFDEACPLQEVAARAAALGLKMSDGHAYQPAVGRLNALRMGFASLDEREMKKIVALLKKATDSCKPNHERK
jgi:GntR family transcriptional regulator/MocR family aminotransferase